MSRRCSATGAWCFRSQRRERTSRCFLVWRCAETKERVRAGRAGDGGERGRRSASGSHCDVSICQCSGVYSIRKPATKRKFKNKTYHLGIRLNCKLRQRQDVHFWCCREPLVHRSFCICADVVVAQHQVAQNLRELGGDFGRYDALHYDKK
jgi:hypothetical protein